MFSQVSVILFGEGELLCAGHPVLGRGRGGEGMKGMVNPSRPYPSLLPQLGLVCPEGKGMVRGGRGVLCPGGKGFWGYG